MEVTAPIHERRSPGARSGSPRGPGGPSGALRETLAGAVLVTAGLEPKTRFEFLDNELEDLEIHAVQGLEKVRAMRRALASEARCHGVKAEFPSATIVASS